MTESLKWSDFKKLIPSTFGEKLFDMGFKNIGYKMYRFRDHYIDIIEFYPNKYHTSYTVEAGSHPRSNNSFNSNGHCWSFMFRYRLLINGSDKWYDLPTNVYEAIIQLKSVEKEIFKFEEQFFRKFETIIDGISLLKCEVDNSFLFNKAQFGSQSMHYNLKILEDILLDDKK